MKPAAKNLLTDRQLCFTTGNCLFYKRYRNTEILEGRFQLSKIFTITAVLIFLLLAACGSNTTGPSEPGDWLPLTVNNWWVTDTSGNWIGTKGDTTGTWTGSFGAKITGVIQHAGGFSVYERKAFRSITTTTPDSSWTAVDTLYDYFRKTDEDLRCYEDTTTLKYDILLRFPVTLGDSWLKTDSSQIELEVTSLSETVTVPAGTFENCIVVRETSPISSGYAVTNHYYHRGIGQVQALFTMEGMSGTIKLNNYNIL